MPAAMSVSKRSTVGDAAPDLVSANEAASESFFSFARTLQVARDSAVSLRLDPAQGLAMQWANLCFSKALAARSRTYADPLTAEEDPEDWDQTSDAQAWTVEGRTWVLVAQLTAERHARALGDQPVQVPQTPYASPVTRAYAAVANDATLSEVRVVRDWLQRHVLPISHPVEMRKGYWTTTKNNLKSARRTGLRSRPTLPTPNLNASTTSLDPDLPLRSSAALDPQDSQYDKAAWRYLFEAVRNGRLDLALDVCKAMNHSWKAASLRGALLYANAWIGDESEPVGNRNRFLWKTVARKLASDISIDPYERALYGVLGGELSSVLSVSQSWEEQLWALVYTTFESKIDTLLAKASNDLPLGQSNWGLGTGQADSAAAAGIKVDGAIEGLASLNLRNLFERLDQSDVERISTQAKDPYRMFQRDLIISDVDSLLLSAETRLSQARATMTRGQYARYVRFFAHYVLFTRVVNPEAEQARQDNLAAGYASSASELATNTILRAYVELLEEAGQGDDLVALYASSLDRTNAIDSYAQYLRSLDPNLGNATRWNALRQADDHQLDLPAVARRTTQLILDEAIPALGDVLHSTSDVRLDLSLTAVENRLITSLTWLAFAQETWTDYIVQANRVLRLFLASGRVHAARRLIFDLSPDIVAAAIHAPDGELTLSLPNSHAKEHFGYHLLNAFYHSTDTFHSIWAQEPDLNTRTAVSGWSHQVSEAVDAVYKAALDLLRDHWLVLELDVEPLRQELLGRIQQLYIPDVVLRLHSLFVDTHSVVPHSLARALQLPNLVMDETYRLYLAFLTSKGNGLLPYLSLIREAALLQLDQDGAESGDPFTVARWEDPQDEEGTPLYDETSDEASMIDLIPEQQ